MNIKIRILIASIIFFSGFSLSILQTVALDYSSVPVLTFHSIDVKTPNPQIYSVVIGKDRLDEILIALKKEGYKSISLSEFFNPTSCIKKPILLTFDDGFTNFYDNATPILQKHGYGAVSAVITSNIGKKGFMNEAQLKKLYRKGVEIISHTVFHTDLTKLDASSIKKELLNSKTRLNSITGKNISYIAYPFGGVNDIVIKEAKKLGYLGGFSNTLGIFKPGTSDTFKVNRIRIDNQTKVAELVKYLGTLSKSR